VSARTEARLWAAQRISAMLLGVFVTVHLITIFYAMRGGLSADEILSRTRGNLGWLLFYTLFVIGAAVHGPIGLRAILAEWLSWQGRVVDALLVTFGITLGVLGFRAAWAVFV
jgi:fumarate reductase subunit C